jgi:hypothetical protein
MQTTPTVQILALAAAIIMLVGGALIVYRRLAGNTYLTNDHTNGTFFLSLP